MTFQDVTAVFSFASAFSISLWLFCTVFLTKTFASVITVVADNKFTPGPLASFSIQAAAKKIL